MTEFSKAKAAAYDTARREWRPWHWRHFGRRVVSTEAVRAALAIKYGSDGDGRRAGRQ
jgi:hypothetical protein